MNCRNEHHCKNQRHALKAVFSTNCVERVSLKTKSGAFRLAQRLNEHGKYSCGPEEQVKDLGFSGIRDFSYSALAYMNFLNFMSQLGPYGEINLQINHFIFT
jgi:hypothetical protein